MSRKDMINTSLYILVVLHGEPTGTPPLWGSRPPKNNEAPRCPKPRQAMWGRCQPRPFRFLARSRYTAFRTEGTDQFGETDMGGPLTCYYSSLFFFGGGGEMQITFSAVPGWGWTIQGHLSSVHSNRQNTKRKDWWAMGS